MQYFSQVHLAIFNSYAQNIWTKVFTVKVDTCRPFIFSLCTVIVFLLKPWATPVKLKHFSQNTGMPICTGLVLSEDLGVHQKTVGYCGWNCYFPCHVQIIDMADLDRTKIRFISVAPLFLHNHIQFQYHVLEWWIVPSVRPPQWISQLRQAWIRQVFCAHWKQIQLQTLD